jgi:hypothetical protein
VIACYAEVDGRLVPVILLDHSLRVTVVRDRHLAHAQGIFGDTFILGSLESLGAQMARNLAAAHRPEAVG